MCSFSNFGSLNDWRDVRLVYLLCAFSYFLLHFYLSNIMLRILKCICNWQSPLPETKHLSSYHVNEPRHEKMCLRESPTRQDTNWPAQLQRPARILKFQIYKLHVSFCLGSEQQRRWSDCADAQADLRLCCSHMAKRHFFSWPGSNVLKMLRSSFAEKV